MQKCFNCWNLLVRLWMSYFSTLSADLQTDVPLSVMWHGMLLLLSMISVFFIVCLVQNQVPFLVIMWTIFCDSLLMFDSHLCFLLSGSKVTEVQKEDEEPNDCEPHIQSNFINPTCRGGKPLHVLCLKLSCTTYCICKSILFQMKQTWGLYSCIPQPIFILSQFYWLMPCGSDRSSDETTSLWRDPRSNAFVCVRLFGWVTVSLSYPPARHLPSSTAYCEGTHIVWCPGELAGCSLLHLIHHLPFTLPRLPPFPVTINTASCASIRKMPNPSLARIPLIHHIPQTLKTPTAAYCWCKQRQGDMVHANTPTHKFTGGGGDRQRETQRETKNNTLHLDDRSMFEKKL